ncbi:MAG TPA: SurA N-terminal domain-containing protein [Solirubrobacteraceae bacterium]|jgi:Raf kinase inhibitor-like YbhB/YbcL family protein|nr:SurA N-terminal domain-containing protein [Solirubrobacteraceae bacterium]
MGSRAVAPAALAALIALAALTGCGGATKTTTTVVTAAGQAGSGAPATQASVGETVATVERTPITKASFEHWTSVTAAVSHSKSHSRAARAALKNQVLGFLITSQWVLAEAAHMGIHVSEAEVRQRLHQITVKQYPKASQLKRYLASIGETEADLLMRVKVELLEAKISQHVTAGKTATTEPHLLLSDFQKSFETRWRARTSCQPGYVVEDCRQYKGTRHSPAGSSSSSPATSSSSSSSSSSSHSASTSARSNASGELPSIPGAMAISSPAFERNGTIPTQYTCDGANTSPPLQWQHLPAHTKELVLFIIDDSSDGAEGGIRWVVAGIEPSLSGLSAGQLPAGAVVGLNGSGKATYGGICPPKGKSAAIEFVLWALNKTIPLSNGFIPAVAEHDYSHSELASAITYATYTRP